MRFKHLFFLALTSVATVSGFSVAHADIGPIRIGLTCPFTGGSAPMGESLRNAVRLAVEEINWKGGLLGRQIELVERDDEGNPDKGRALAQELIEREKVIATIGSCNTGVVLKNMDLYQKARIPLLVPVATGVAITTTFANHPEHYIFRTAANDEIQARLVAQEAGIAYPGVKLTAVQLEFELVIGSVPCVLRAGHAGLSFSGRPGATLNLRT